jgi:hypothetical protein
LEDNKAIPIIPFEDIEVVDKAELYNKDISNMSFNKDFPDYSILIKYNRVKELDPSIIRVALGLFYTTSGISRSEY